MTFSAERTIHASASDVVAVLRDVRTLAAWNPALRPLRPADPDAVIERRYRTAVRGLLPATVVFTRLEPSVVEYRLRGGGAEERGRWLLAAAEGGEVRVTHSFEHTGVLLRALRGSFTTVAQWRVERLESEVRAREE